MKVKELIAQLSNLDGDMPLFITCNSENADSRDLYEISEISQKDTVDYGVWKQGMCLLMLRYILMIHIGNLIIIHIAISNEYKDRKSHRRPHNARGLRNDISWQE